MTLRWAKAAKKRQKVALARLILGWQDVRKMNASDNQFSLTRTALSTCGRAKNQIPISTMVSPLLLLRFRGDGVRRVASFLTVVPLCLLAGFAARAGLGPNQALPILGGEFSVFNDSPPPSAARQFIFSLPDSALLTNVPPTLSPEPIGLVTNLYDPANPVYFSFGEGVWVRPDPSTPAMERDCPQPQGPPIHATGQGGASLGVFGGVMVRMQPTLNAELANRILPAMGNDPAISSYTFSPITLVYTITNGSFNGQTVTLKGVMAYGSGQNTNDLPGYDENWTGELFLALDWGTDPLGFKEFALIQCVLTAGVTTDDSDCLPLTDVSPVFLGSANASSYFASVWQALLGQVASGSMHLQGPIPELLFLYDFTGVNSVTPAQTLPPGTLDLSTVFPLPSFGASGYTNANKFINQYDAGVAFSLPKRFNPPNPVPSPSGFTPGGNACGPTALGMALYANQVASVDARSVFDNTTTKGLAVGNNIDNAFDFCRAEYWLANRPIVAYNYSSPSPLPSGTVVSYRNATGASPTASAITATWKDIDSLLGNKQPIVIRTDLGLGVSLGGGHCILLLGLGHNDDFGQLYHTKGDYYIVADPAGHYFANTDGTHYDLIANLRYVDAGINYGGWFAMYPKELLHQRTYDKHAGNYRLTGITIGAAFHSPSVHVVAHSPVVVLLTDPLGRQTGVMPDGTVVQDIPNSYFEPAVMDEEEDGVSSYDPNGPKEVELDDPIDGVYQVQLTGTNSGSFVLDWNVLNTNGVAADSQTFSGTVTNGQHLTYTFTVKLGGTPSLQYLVNNGALALFWPTNATGFGLQTTTNLSSPTSWVAATGALSVLNGEYTVTNTFSNPLRFFRLKQ